MNKVFGSSLAGTNENTVEKKCFTFGFSLDSTIAEETTSKIKKKSKPKKKKKLTASELNLDDVPYIRDEIGDSLATQDQTALAITTLVSVPNCVANISGSSPNQSNILPEEVVSQVVHVEVANDEGNTKKKKKKTKNKGVKTTLISKDDDMDYLEREIALLATVQHSAVIKPTSNMNAELGTKNSNKSQNNKDVSTSNASFSFKSHKDPELSEEQRSLFRYGNGKNLVAIGPPKHKGDPIWKLPPPPGLKAPDNINSNDDYLNNLSHCSPDGTNDTNVNDDGRDRTFNSNGDKIVAPLLSHNSPFSFGFGF